MLYNGLLPWILGPRAVHFEQSYNIFVVLHSEVDSDSFRRHPVSVTLFERLY